MKQHIVRIGVGLAITLFFVVHAAELYPTRDELKLWNQTLRAYRAPQWNQVELSLLNVQRMNPACGLYQVYADRVVDKRRNPPPPGWDGVTAFDEK